MPLVKGAVRWNTGVYCIRNKTNGKRYVGSASQTFKKRWNYHIYELRNQIHYNRHLQSAWNKYGEEAFEFIVLQRCHPDDCVTYEQVWLDRYKSADSKYGYNLSPTAGSTLGVKFTDEVKARLSEWHTGKVLTEEHKKNIGEAGKGRKHTEEAKEKIRQGKLGKPMPAGFGAKMSKLLTGYKHSEEARRNMSLSKIGNTNTLGYKHTEESRQRISEGQRGRKHSEESIRKRSESLKRYYRLLKESKNGGAGAEETEGAGD